MKIIFHVTVFENVSENDTKINFNLFWKRKSFSKVFVTIPKATIDTRNILNGSHSIYKYDLFIMFDM